MTRPKGSASRAGSAFAVAAWAVLLAMAAPAAADQAARAEYREQVEPICKRNSIANRNILAGARAKVRRGKLESAGRQFMRAAAALRHALAELRRVPSPEADRELLSRWWARIARQATLLGQTGKALVSGRLRRAESLVNQLSSGARMTNALVVGFGFNYCRFEAPQYV